MPAHATYQRCAAHQVLHREGWRAFRDPEQSVRQQIYFRALSTLPHVEIHLGHFLSHEVWMPVADPAPNAPRFVRVIKTEEKGSDVNLATHLVSDAYEDLFDVAVVISNDSDLLAPVKLAKDRLHKRVGVLNPQKHQSPMLAKSASFFKQIRTGALRASQFPIALSDAKGVFEMPAKWQVAPSLLFFLNRFSAVAEPPRRIHRHVSTSLSRKH